MSMIVVSGASGFIGRRLATRLLDQHPATELRCLVWEGDESFCQGGTEQLRAGSIVPVRSDLVTGRGLAGLRSPKLIFHLAGNTHTWEPDQRCNDVGTQNLLRAISPLDPKSHLVFTSSVAVMDNRQDLTNPLRVETPVNATPMSRYGVTKWRAEEFLQAEARERGFRLSIVRLCTVYGPCPRPNSFFDVLMRQVTGGTVASRLNWPGLTSFVHVDDVVECLLRISDDPPPPGEPRTRILAAESRTLEDVARLTHEELELNYRGVRLPESVWRFGPLMHAVCRSTSNCLPEALYNHLWRLNLVINPVFHCDTNLAKSRFPEMSFRSLHDSVGEVLRGQAPKPRRPGAAHVAKGQQAS